MTQIEFGNLVVSILDKVCAQRGIEFEDFGNGLGQKTLQDGKIVYVVREFRKGLLTYEETQMRTIKLCLWTGATSCDSESVQTTEDRDSKRLETDIEEAIDRLLSAEKGLSVGG